MGIKFANNATGTLASSINNSVTTITLTAGQGGLFPSLTAGDYFYATIYNASNQIEIIKVTARSTDTLTVLRGQEGTTSRAYAAGDRIDLRPTAASLSDIVTEATQNSLPKAGGTMTGTLNVLAETSMNSGVADVLTVRGEDRTFRLRQTGGGLYFYDNVRNVYAFGADSAGNLVGVGIIRQVVSQKFTGVTDTTSTSYIDTFASLSITPTAANSKIFVIVEGMGAHFDYSGAAKFRLVRMPSTVVVGDHILWGSNGFNQPPYQTWSSITLQAIDTPNTTSLVTYKVQLANINSGSSYFGANDVNGTSFTIMEISQ